MLVAEKLEAVRDYIASKPGHERNRWGHVHVEANGKEYRYKFMTNVIRKELKIKYEDGSSGWIRIKSYNISDAYKNLVNKDLIKDRRWYANGVVS